MTASPAAQAKRHASETGSGWRWQVLVLVVLTMASTLVFWVTDLDLRVAGIFYHPEAAGGPWPDHYLPFWQLLYHGVPVLTGLFIAGGFLGLLLSVWRPGFLSWRRPAILLLLTLAIGPGLLVNALFKDMWGRPRPREVVEFNGQLPYLPPLRMGATRDGKSFTAGHASVGFCLFVWWFTWLRGRPVLAWAALIAAIVSGGVIGVGRLAAGAHFLSDVLWAAYVTYFTALVLHYFVLRERL